MNIKDKEQPVVAEKKAGEKRKKGQNQSEVNSPEAQCTALEEDLATEPCC